MLVDEVLQETLAWVNEVRSTLARAPIETLPAGIPCDPQACPLGKALDARVTHDGRVVLEGSGYVLRLPEAVRAFAGAYDVGAFPELELDLTLLAPV